MIFARIEQMDFLDSEVGAKEALGLVGDEMCRHGFRLNHKEQFEVGAAVGRTLIHLEFKRVRYAIAADTPSNIADALYVSVVVLVQAHQKGADRELQLRIQLMPFDRSDEAPGPVLTVSGVDIQSGRFVTRTVIDRTTRKTIATIVLPSDLDPTEEREETAKLLPADAPKFDLVLDRYRIHTHN
jgi:hypothetical protein